MIKKETKDDNDLVAKIEGISSEIQLLALNIAVAAAKIAHKQDLGVEINQKLSQLVNHATQTVKQMNKVLNVAGTEKKNGLTVSEINGIESDLIESIEEAMQSIISDSDKITRLLAGVKKR